MSFYRRLTRMDRYQIHEGIARGLSIRAIARVLCKNPSTISRELKRNRMPKVSWVDYKPDLADEIAKTRTLQKRPRKSVIVGDLEVWIVRHLKLDWSPEQIVGRCKRLQINKTLSHPTIYRYVYKDAKNGGSLYQHLRTQKNKKTKRRNYRPYTSISGPKKNLITERPMIVNKRKRIGDYERDLVHGTGQQQAGASILSIVDRTSRLTKLQYLPKKSADSIHKATVELLKRQKVRTITNDNGSEFATFLETEKKLKTKVYFCQPGRYWERGTNENTNGLLRQYFPRKINFEKINSHHVKKVEKLLNSRPRKCLAYRTPREVHENLSVD